MVFIVSNGLQYTGHETSPDNLRNGVVIHLTKLFIQYHKHWKEQHILLSKKPETVLFIFYFSWELKSHFHSLFRFVLLDDIFVFAIYNMVMSSLQTYVNISRLCYHYLTVIHYPSRWLFHKISDASEKSWWNNLNLYIGIEEDINNF